MNNSIITRSGALSSMASSTAIPSLAAKKGEAPNRFSSSAIFKAHSSESPAIKIFAGLFIE